MSIGRKIKIIKKNILLFIKNFFPEYLYNLLIYRISKKKFSKVLNSPKIYIKKSSNLDKINNYEFKYTSQNNEDGIIEYLTSKISEPDKFFVEIGFDYNEFNSLNLIKNKWNGYLIEGDELKCDKLNSCIKHFFKNQKIYIENLFVDYENINEILQKKVNKSNFDFFSLDTDGMDYWILEKLNFQPKIICAEYNPWLDKLLSLTIPKIKKFNYQSDMYYGMSLKALTILMKKKNYKMVAVESSGNNAFFIKQNEFNIEFDEINPETSFKKDPKFSQNFYNEIYSKLIKKKWIEIN